MCGIVGFLDPRAVHSRDDLRSRLRRMASAIRHRGPDGAGFWEDPEAGIGLGHRRLSVIDLTETGDQPMLSENGRYVLVFNGEIYNFRELRTSLRERYGSTFRGHSDTEVMLAAFEAWGVREALRRFNGMFAFALWDSAERALTLARDRLGEKPLYYAAQGSRFFFASELKALRAHPDFAAQVNHDALVAYLRNGCIPGRLSIYVDVHKLAPGCLLSLKESQPPVLDSYWDLVETAHHCLSDPFRGDDEQAIEEMQSLLTDSVRLRMLADVPLGVLLSGGIDSSLITAIMQTQSSSAVRTFSIAFDNPELDESKYASRIAASIGTHHTEFMVTAQEAQDVIPSLPLIYDEPFGDSSQIPTHIVSQVTRRQVTVALTGDGGDELFGGYNRHLWGAEVFRSIRSYPLFFRGLASSAITLLSPDHWDKTIRRLRPLLPRELNQPAAGEKLHKVAQVLDAPDLLSLYTRLLAHCSNPEQIVAGHFAHEGGDERSAWLPSQSPAEQMMLLDCVGYLPDDILVKVDRASMAASLETRIPFLDHRVVEFSLRLPLSLKIRAGTGKWLLRQLLSRYIPTDLFERPKSGFAVPLSNWLRGPLRPWAESLLDEDRLGREGYFNAAAVRKVWAHFLRHGGNLQFHLWDILMFQAWLEAQSGTESFDLVAASVGGAQ